ncbi:endonuclease MutS2 [Melioribacteraceae bacterium 4301-Me]|uniref:endonuclease MutS2 n=1 Tax=Pyranulibacter aquaticus TaxID=3163344 RepID=UPI00359933A7
MITKETLEKLEFFKVTEYAAKYCYTELGKTLTLNLRPLSKLDEVINEGKRVSQAKEILIKLETPPFSSLPDISEIIAKSRIDGAVLTIRNILDVLTLAEVSRKIVQFFRNKGSEFPDLYFLAKELFVDKVFESHITRIIDENGDIKDDATPRLKEIRREIKEKEESLRKVVNTLLKTFSDSYLVQDEYITLRDGRIVLPIKSEHKRHIKGFIHSESSTGQTVYIEPEETLELNNDILSLNFAEKREIEKILRSLTEKIGSLSNQLKNSLDLIALLDSYFARAKYSIEILGSFPSFLEDKPIQLLDLRHPILIKKVGIKNTVPLNLKVDNQKVILITGPNAGGKTVVLKTVGISVLMVQSGFHIPCHPDSNLHFFSDILVDIGDQQSIEEDLSTFSSHLSNINKIINCANETSLVLLDEIGTGTDPVEGSALAIGILQTLKEKNALVLATTHHGNLKILANELEGFENASMEFDTQKLVPTYKFHQGIPGSSYAFEVVERIGFSKSFISLAKKYLDVDKNKVERFLIDIEQKSKELRKQLNQLEVENIRLKGLANLYQQKVENLEREKNKILLEAKQKAQDYLKDVNKKIEAAIKNIRESKANKEIVHKERQEIKELQKEIESKISFEQTKEPVKGSFRIGDYVSIKNTNTVGIISGIDENKNKAIIVIGSIKLQSKISDLVHANKIEPQTADFKRNLYDSKIHNYRLDIRGKRVDESEKEIIKFLDDAYSSGVDRIEILHGKGTGALKQKVQEILKNYKYVKNYYFADIESGGDGITIVEF